MRENEPLNKPVKPDISAIEITDERFEKMTKTTLDMVEGMGIGKDGLNPIIIVHHRSPTEDGMLSDEETDLFMVAGEFNDHELKRKTLRKIGASIFERQCVISAVFMASEAWMATEQFKKDVRLMPSECPDRKEVLIISGKTVTGDCKVGIFIPIKRDKDNIISRDGENTVTKELAMPLLDQVMYGFTEAAMAKFSDSIPDDLKKLWEEKRDRR